MAVFPLPSLGIICFATIATGTPHNTCESFSPGIEIASPDTPDFVVLKGLVKGHPVIILMPPGENSSVSPLFWCNVCHIVLKLLVSASQVDCELSWRTGPRCILSLHWHLICGKATSSFYTHRMKHRLKIQPLCTVSHNFSVFVYIHMYVSFL